MYGLSWITNFFVKKKSEMICTSDHWLIGLRVTKILSMVSQLLLISYTLFYVQNKGTGENNYAAILIINY